MDTLVIGRVFSPSVLGLFYRAQSLNNLVIKFAFSSISNVVLSAFSKMQKDIDMLRVNMNKLMHLVAFTTFFFAGLVYLSAEQIIIILFTEKWIDAVPFFKIFSLFALYYTMPNIINSAINSIGKSDKVLKIQIVSKLLLLIFIPIGLYYGIHAYIYATLLAGSIGLIYAMYVVSICIGIEFKSQLLLVLKYLSVYFLLIFSLDYIQITNRYLHIVVLSFVYIFLYCIFNKIIKNEGVEYSYNILHDIVMKIRKR